ncbi:MAG: glycosyltransferase family 39 protein [Anaerolineae bacterium]|nr:glycosyltransferase family 39 protein [Anaerolineae bacterium]
MLGIAARISSTIIGLSSRSVAVYLEAAALAAILALAAYLRFVNVDANPGWYTDECVHLDIAQKLLDGRVQYLAVGQSMLLFSRLPLFDLLLAGLLRLGGDGMLTLRALTGGLGIISIVMLYSLVRRAGRCNSLALTAALMLAIYPQAVLYSRFGFSYNLLTPLVLLACLGLAIGSCSDGLEPSRRRWLALACLSIGLGAASDLWMLVLSVPALLVVSLHRRRDVLWGLLLIAIPPGFTAAAMLLSAPQAFWFDCRYVFSRLSGLSLAEQIANVGQNAAMLLEHDVRMAPALIGLFMLRPARLRGICLLMFLFPIVALGRVVALFNLSAYYTIPLLPFVALGIASLVWHGVPHVFRVARESLLFVLTRWLPDHRPHTGLLNVTAGLSLLIIVFPLWNSLIGTFDAIREGFRTPIDPFLVDANDAHRAADFVNAHTDPTDVVIASPATAWLLDAQAADFQMAIAAAGQATPHLPADIPSERFVFDPRFTEARYVVIDNLWRNWGTIHVPGLAPIIDALESREPVFIAGEVAVYHNLVFQE